MQLKFILPAVLLSGSVYAQNISGEAAEKKHLSQSTNLDQVEAFQPSELAITQSAPSMAPLASTSQVYDGVLETVIGTTTYDLQTNRSVQSRLVSHGEGKLGAIWTMSQVENSSFADRGTGYNFYDGTEWGDQPTERIENLRTGWPSMLALGDGSEVFLSHVFTDPAGANEFGKRTTAGTGSWNMGTVSDGSNDLELSWIRMANGGTDGNTVHIIGHKKFPELVVGTNNPGYISYSRSTDGGTTWDIHDSILPEIDSSYYKAFGGDGYAITAKGNTVAFVIGGSDRDLVLMKSIDNGSTWTKNIIWSFPIAKFDPSIHLVDSTEYEDGRINTADGSYSIAIDGSDNIHTFMGNYYMANGTLDGNTSWFPLTDGLLHWSEEYGYADSLNAHQGFDTVAYMLDSLQLPTTGNPTDYIASYFTSLSSFPHAAIDANGDIYVTYSGIVNGLYEDQIGAGEEFEKVYRHQYVVRSQDGGITWSTPRDLMAEFLENNDIFFEGMYGNIVLDGTDMYVLYQRDDMPGINIQPADDNPHDIIINDMVLTKVSTADFNVIGLEESAPISGIHIFPNPISDGKTSLQFELNNPEIVQVSILNLIGQNVQSLTVNANTSNTLSMDVSTLHSGVYLVKIATDKSSLTTKFVIQ